MPVESDLPIRCLSALVFRQDAWLSPSTVYATCFHMMFTVTLTHHSCMRSTRQGALLGSSDCVAQHTSHSILLANSTSHSWPACQRFFSDALQISKETLLAPIVWCDHLVMQSMRFSISLQTLSLLHMLFAHTYGFCDLTVLLSAPILACCMHVQTHTA